MANSVNATIQQKLAANLVLSDVDGIGVDVSTPISEFDRVIQLGGTSTPAIDTIGFAEHVLAGVTELIDLTALPSFGGNVDGTGKKIQAVLFRMPSTNVAAMTIDVTGANPVDVWGSAFSLTLPPNGGITIYTPEGGSDISGTVKTIELNGTIADKLQYVILLG